MDKTKNGIARKSIWQPFAITGKLSILPSYFLICCPQHLRPDYLRNSLQDAPQPLIKRLSGLPAYTSVNYAKANDNGLKNGETDNSELYDAPIEPYSSNGNEDEDHGAVSRLQNFEHFQTIQSDLLAENRLALFEFHEDIGSANFSVISFAVRPRALAIFHEGTQRVGGKFIAAPQLLITSDIHHEIEAKFDDEDEAACISAGAARPTMVEHNDLGGQSINLIEEVEATVMEESFISTEETTNAANVRSYVPTHLICTICQDDLSEFWDKSVNVPKDDFVRHHEICWKKRPRNLPNAPDTNTAQYMGTKNLCTISKAEAKKVPSCVSNPTHCASCNKDLVEMDIVDAVVHKMNCFHAYCVQQEAWICPICNEGIAGFEFDEENKEYQRFRHVDSCNGIRIRNEVMAEKYLQLYSMAQGVRQRIDWATNGYRGRYGKKPKSGDRMRDVKDRFFLEHNKFPIGRSKLRNETLHSGEISTHAFGRSSQVEVLENLGLFQRSQFAVTHEGMATRIVAAIEKDEAQRVLKNDLLAEAEQKHAAIKRMQLQGEKKVVEANRKRLASFRVEQRLAVLKKEEDEQVAASLEVDENLLDLSDRNSELSYIDPADLEASKYRDRSTSPERSSDSDSDELPTSRATTPDELPRCILAKPSAQKMELDSNSRASDWATEVQEAMEAIMPSYAVNVVAPFATIFHQLPSVDEQYIPKNLLPSKAEAKKQRIAEKKAQRAQFAEDYAIFWAEEDALVKSVESEVEAISISKSQHESGNSLADDEASESRNIVRLATPGVFQDVDDNLTTIPNFKDPASKMKHKSHVARTKEQHRHELPGDKHKKKTICIQKRKQRMKERAQTKIARLWDAASKYGQMRASESLLLQLRIHGLYRIVANAENKVRKVVADNTETTKEELVILPVQISAELICGKGIRPRVDSGTEMSLPLEADNTSPIIEAVKVDDAQKLVESHGRIPTIAFMDKHIVKPGWTSPLDFMAQSAKPSTFLERMRARAQKLFSGDVE